MAHRRSGVDRTSGAASRGPHSTSIAIVVLGAAFVAPIALFAAAFEGDIHPLGPDVFGYIWQSRIVGVLPLANVGTRPGFPAFAAALSGVHPMTRAIAPLVLGPVMTVVFAAAVAATVVLAFRLPAWALGPIAFAVAVWGGATHMATGYLANELSLACIVAALFLLAVAGSVGFWRLACALGAATAAGLAHPGLLPFYLGVGGAWLVLSLPGWLRDRPSWRVSIAGSAGFLAVLAVAGGVVAIVVFGIMGQRLADVTNLTEGVADFGGRLAEMVGIVGLWVSAVSVLAAVGVVIAWRSRGGSARDVIHLGLAWAAIAAAGALLTLARATFPGHRSLLMMVPLPAAAGLGIVGLGWAVARWGGEGVARAPSAIRVVGAVAVMGIACVLVTLPGSHRLTALARLPVRGDPARLVASYVATVGPGVPVLVLSSPGTERVAPFTWRGRENQVRAYVPSAQIVRTFVVVGVPDASGGVTRPPRGRDGSAEAIDASWSQAGPALADGALVVAPKAYTAHRIWERLATDPARLVTPDLAVVRGPDTVPDVAVPPAEVSGTAGTGDGIACLLVLVAIGGGFALAAAWGRGGTVVHALALAPALGAVSVTLVGVGLALIGADPGGIAGVVTFLLIAGVGYWQARRTWYRHTRPGVSSTA